VPKTDPGAFHLWAPDQRRRREAFTRCGIRIEEGMLLLVARDGLATAGVTICGDCREVPAPSQGAQWILVVDDDPDIREAFVTVLTDEGYRVASVDDGAQAFSWLERHGQDTRAILLDLMMPVMDGREFLKRKSATPALRDVPVVVITAGGGCQDLVNTRLACNCLIKPVSIEKLIQAVGGCRAPALRAAGPASPSVADQ
jgi:CheY-like chemotaxis protein